MACFYGQNLNLIMTCFLGRREYSQSFLYLYLMRLNSTGTLKMYLYGLQIEISRTPTDKACQQGHDLGRPIRGTDSIGARHVNNRTCDAPPTHPERMSR